MNDLLISSSLLGFGCLGLYFYKSNQYSCVSETEEEENIVLPSTSGFFKEHESDQEQEKYKEYNYSIKSQKNKKKTLRTKKSSTGTRKRFTK